MRETINKILLSHMKIDEVSEDSSLITDFGLSSLEIAELICDMEDALDFEIPEEDLMHLKTVGDIYEYVEDLE